MFIWHVQECVVNVDIWQCIDICDILKFLVSRTSFVIRKQLKSYKSLGCHNYAIGSRVKEPKWKRVSLDTVIVATQVNSLLSTNDCIDFTADLLYFLCRSVTTEACKA